VKVWVSLRRKCVNVRVGEVGQVGLQAKLKLGGGGGGVLFFRRGGMTEIVRVDHG